MSKLETNQVDPSTGTTLTLGTSGDTIAIPSGVTIANSGTATGFGLSGWSSSSGNLLSADASKGIYLGVNSATAANLLDDYEEGTFTPEITDGIGSRTHSSQLGFYTKIGNVCTVKIQVVLSGGSANSNRLGISGLPFTVMNQSPGDGLYFQFLDSSFINSTSTNPPTIWLTKNTTTITFFKTTGADFTGNDVASASSLGIYLAGSYLTT